MLRANPLAFGTGDEPASFRARRGSFSTQGAPAAGADASLMNMLLEQMSAREKWEGDVTETLAALATQLNEMARQLREATRSQGHHWM